MCEPGWPNILQPADQSSAASLLARLHSCPLGVSVAPLNETRPSLTPDGE
jgi:hypothetical protein